MDNRDNLPENKRQEEQAPKEKNNETLTGKIDLERGKATDCPGDGEGDRNDTKEMEDINRIAGNNS